MKVTATAIQNNFGKYLQEASRQDIVVTKNNREVAKLVTVGKETSGSTAASKAGAYSREIIRGKEYVLGPFPLAHQVFYGHVVRCISAAAEKAGLTPLFQPNDVVFKSGNGHDHVKPDICLLDDVSDIDKNDRFEGVPDLIIEIASQETLTKDMTVKLELYMKNGVTEYWIINENAGKTDVYLFNKGSIAETATFKLKEEIESFAFEGFKVRIDH